ncbi:NUDIX hydrolase [Alisedimentitalea sp. MJ-SS2]|uniref:NUDIX hydrolase n=1 Tax=Aliisedimentitalea sp. MJ-SS2 TaxID=3049795 RepID=UPI0029117FF8|nr:NUDIX hydrolase [Alisedimentitalea sp. MJ-SS2]MDU8927250.1 NUDIX hydrolase [Alisedimentitalea sp. MJ-SS2]
MTSRPIRLATRALILNDDRLLLVNAFPGPATDLWCAPGGGVEKHSSLPDNLIREVHEETGLSISVGPPALINEFHNPDDGFHQVEVFFRCKIVSGDLSDDWRDPENIVHRRRWFTRTEMSGIRFKPDGLPDAAFNRGIGYDPLERLVKA